MSFFDGAIIIGSRDRYAQSRGFKAFDANRQQEVDPIFSAADAADVEAAGRLAEAAFPAFAADRIARVHLLEAVADSIQGLGDVLVDRATAETGLPSARIESERARTVSQLRFFATVIAQGDYLDATIDSALPDRRPMPRPDLRRMFLPVGPVAVFGASNFPLAFSVAGGDTASALAAGCPVVVKGHPAHPGTGELVARAVREAVQSCGFPEGVFSYLPGEDHALGQALVSDPRIRAVGFTGSRAVGLALMRIAAERPVPIPVFAEMSSVNPVLLFPAALAARGEDLANGFIASLTLGTGQFCTNPGLVIGLAGPALDAFMDAAGRRLSEVKAGVMLTPGIRMRFGKMVEGLAGKSTVETIGTGARGEQRSHAVAALFSAKAETFLGDPDLSDEVFGPSGLIVRCRDLDEMKQVVARLEGQLTASLMMDEDDWIVAREFMPLLTTKVGRILANGWPTGVEVSHAMVHGGPFPATSDGRTTSVGSLAIARFLKPVCLQDVPDALLPSALRNANPMNLTRRIDGRLVVA